MAVEEKEKVEVFEIDDDFDPLEDTGIEFEDEDEEGGASDYQVPVIPDADRSVVPAPVELPAEERIDKLIKGLPGQKFRILEGVRVCDEPKTLEEASEALETAFPQGASVYTAARIIELLADAGALDRIDPEPEEDEEAQDSETAEGEASNEQATEAEIQEGAAPAAATAAATAVTASAEIGPETAEAASAEAAADDRVESISWDDVDATADFEEVEQAAPSLYVATEAGREAVESRWSASVAEKVVAAEPRYLPIWKEVLQLCDVDGGATKKQIESKVDKDPLLQEPRRWCQYFLGKYKDVDALKWDKTWQITDIGRELLGSDLFVGVEAAGAGAEPSEETAETTTTASAAKTGFWA